jgi:predicted phage terminase large subunit-like protein
MRRTFAQLEKADGMIARSHEWLGGTDAKWNGVDKKWRFPSGAVLEFGHMQNEKDKFNFQSAAYQFVGFDELTQFSETQYRYLFSRTRRLEGSTLPIRVRSASNPGGEGHDWVKRRFLTEREDSRLFIPAKLADNPYLDQADYRQSLMELDPITRAQLLDGDWNVRQSGAMFKREWFEIVSAVPAKAKRVRAWDFAATLPKLGKDPDWTVGTLMAEADGTYYVENVKRDRLTPRGVEKLLVQTTKADGHGITQWLEQEGGSSGKIATDAYVRATAGYTVRSQRPTGSKADRARPLASQAEAGNVKLVEGPWVGTWLDEFEAFAPDCSHDDQVDSASLGFEKLHSTGVSWADLYGEGEAA